MGNIHHKLIAQRELCSKEKERIKTRQLESVQLANSRTSKLLCHDEPRTLRPRKAVTIQGKKISANEKKSVAASSAVSPQRPRVLPSALTTEEAQALRDTMNTPIVSLPSSSAEITTPGIDVAASDMSNAPIISPSSSSAEVTTPGNDAAMVSLKRKAPTTNKTVTVQVPLEMTVKTKALQKAAAVINRVSKDSNKDLKRARKRRLEIDAPPFVEAVADIVRDHAVKSKDVFFCV